MQNKKKIRKVGSYLSMDNFGGADKDDSSVSERESDSNSENNSKAKGSPNLKVDSESLALDPTFILEKAYSTITAVGSSTAMVAIRNQKEINISNLGDSGFIIIRFRNGEAYTAARSKEQQHQFNIPFQLSVLPGQTELDQLKQRGRIEELKKLKNVLKKKDNMCQDKPDDSDEYCYELLDEDIIISATDGVFDNLFSHEIL